MTKVLRPVLYRARWVLSVSAPAVPYGELLVGEDGRIAAVAPRGALEIGDRVEVRELGEAILLPGLVNVHAHPELGMFRGALEDLRFNDWILRLVGAKRSALLEEDSLAAARWTMVELLAGGVTTVAATEMSGAGAHAISEAGMRGVLFQEVFGPDPRQVDASMEELRSALERLGPLESDRLRIGISPHAPYTVSDPLYSAAAKFARAQSLPIAVHIAESRAEHDLVRSGGGDFAPGLHTRGIQTPVRGRSSIEMLERLGVLELAPLLIHCVDVDELDLERIAAAGAAVAHCPVANARLGHGVAPVMAMRAAGIRVGLGTDSVGSNNRLDLFEEARVASILQRAVGEAPDLLNGEELLRLCTIDGARALGLEGVVGTLEPGKDADLCAMGLGGAHQVPSYDPYATLFHAGRATDVVLSAVRGRVLYEKGAHRTLDVSAIREGVEAAAGRLREHRGA